MNEVTPSDSGLGAFVRREWPHWLLLLALFGASAWAWDRVTPPIPTHWNIRGEVDGYGGRVTGLLLVPMIAAGMYGLFLVLPRIDPARANYALFTGPYAVMRFTFALLMAGLHAVLLATALGYPVDAGRWIPAGVGAMFIVLGNVLVKVRPNYFVGVKTPWTLTSAKSWEQTHRAARWVFAGAGAGLVLGALLMQPWFFATVAVLSVGALAWLIYYSYAVWRADPDRVPATGAQPPREDRSRRG